jgi:hypothetical protein
MALIFKEEEKKKKKKEKLGRYFLFYFIFFIRSQRPKNSKKEKNSKTQSMKSWLHQILSSILFYFIFKAIVNVDHKPRFIKGCFN